MMGSAGLPDRVIYAFLFALVTACSTESYYLVEMPGRWLAARLMSGRKNNDMGLTVISIEEIDAAL